MAYSSLASSQPDAVPLLAVGTSATFGEDYPSLVSERVACLDFAGW
jgi:hypothetical protein